MEKFAVDLDKVLDEFELNEDVSHLNSNDHYFNNDNECSVCEVPPSKCNKYHPATTEIKTNWKKEVSLQTDKECNLHPSILLNQQIEKINLDEADFGPSIRTSSENGGFKGSPDKYCIKNVHKSSTAKPLTNGPTNWKEFVNASNQNNSKVCADDDNGESKGPDQSLLMNNVKSGSFSKLLLSSNDVIINDMNKKPDLNITNSGKPDVVPVINSSESQIISRNVIDGDGNNLNNCNEIDPDLSVNISQISSAVNETTVCSMPSESLDFNVNNSESTLAINRNNNVVLDEINSDERDIKIVPDSDQVVNDHNAVFSDISKDEISVTHDETKVNDHHFNRIECDTICVESNFSSLKTDNKIEPIGFSMSTEDVCESDIDEYLKDIDDTDIDNNVSNECVQTDIQTDEISEVESKEMMEECKTIDVEPSMKRQIDQIEGSMHNTGARPKKSYIYNNNNADDNTSCYNCQVELRTGDLTSSGSKSSTDGKIINANRDVNIATDCSEKQMADNIVREVNKTPDVVSNCKVNVSENSVQQSDDRYESSASSKFNLSPSLRKQRPTSLNLPSRLNVEPLEQSDAIGLSSSSNLQNKDLSLVSVKTNSVDSTNNNLCENQSSKHFPSINHNVTSNLQRPSSLPVGTPLSSLIQSTAIKPAGHTPGDLLRIPDLYSRFEGTPSCNEVSNVDEIPPSPSLSNQSGSNISGSPVEGSSVETWPGLESTLPSSPVTSTSTEDEQLGRVAPFWTPDSCATNCMLCEVKFTVIKRRHHCRACGKVLCSQCCNLKTKLQYMNYKDARVCQPCANIISKVTSQDNHQITASDSINSISSGLDISGVEDSASSTGTVSSSLRGRSPNPNNPNEYCSTIPPLQQAQAALKQPPPTVMVPISVLKREGTKNKGEPKQVMFSDGIRPGGDLTDLDISPEPSMPYRRSTRIQKKLTPGPAGPKAFVNNVVNQIEQQHSVSSSSEFGDDVGVNKTELSSSVLQTSSSGLNHLDIEQEPDMPNLLEVLKKEDIDPVAFSVNKNLTVLLKILMLDCCINNLCWCFSTQGMCTVGQDEIIIVLECLPDETSTPTDVFRHLSYLYDEAAKGNVVTDMGHSLVTQSFLGSKDHGGFLYIKPTFQCLNKLVLPPAPYLFGILLQKWEAPWAKVFPMRLMLRLGAEFRYYPCPLISIRFRKPVFCEIGHTIMNVLADFRNYQYVLPSVRGMVTQMEDMKTYVSFPRNRYNEVMKALNNSNDHVLALSCNFNAEADSHLVCVQNEEGNYHTQAINIQNKERKVTGASFVVFNGALKSNSGLSAKFSIVEDGLMVQITSDTMNTLRQSLRDMQDFTIGCGPVGKDQPNELVLVRWVDDDKSVNSGVRSVVDGMEFDGIPSNRIHNGTDYMGDTKLIRWTEVFLIHTDEYDNSSSTDPVNISRLSETLAQACCIALTPHLDQLKEASIVKIGLRVTINSEKVEYEVGANEEKLPDFYMNDLDSELVPVLHRAASNSHEGIVVLELVFYILEY